MTLASILVLGNYYFLGQAGASSFAALTIVTNAIMARFFLKEPFRKRDGFATVLIVGGTTMAAVFGSTSGTHATSFASLLVELTRTEVYIAAGVVVVVVGALEYVLAVVDKGRQGDSSGSSSGKGGSGSGTHTPHPLLWLERPLRPLLAGLYSGSTGFFATAVVYAISNSLSTKEVGGSLGNGYFYIFLVGLPLSIFKQLQTLNTGLKHYPALSIVPIYQASIVTVGVAWGWTFYGEADALTHLNMGLFLLGLAIIVAGIATQLGGGGGGSGASPVGPDSPPEADPGIDVRVVNTEEEEDVGVSEGFVGEEYSLQHNVSLMDSDEKTPLSPRPVANNPRKGGGF